MDFTKYLCSIVFDSIFVIELVTAACGSSMSISTLSETSRRPKLMKHVSYFYNEQEIAVSLHCYHECLSSQNAIATDALLTSSN